MKIRQETTKDHDAVKKLNDLAFGQTNEGEIIVELREKDANAVSFVAEENDMVLGHIFYSTAEIEVEDKKITGLGLAPMAVLPEHQNKGIGKSLLKESLSFIKEKIQVPFIIVLGHPEYYPKAGFEKASTYGIKCQWEGVPDEAFMIMILDKEKMKGAQGIAWYREEWNKAM